MYVHVCMYLCKYVCMYAWMDGWVYYVPYMRMCMYLCTLFVYFYDGVVIRTGSQLYNELCQITKLYVKFFISSMNFKYATGAAESHV